MQANGNLSSSQNLPSHDHHAQAMYKSSGLDYSDYNLSFSSHFNSLNKASQVPRGLEKRLVTSRRGKLSRTVVSAHKMPRILASPKGNHHPISPRVSSRGNSGEGKLRPSFPTRPLSGPKKVKKSSNKPRCNEEACTKKLTLTSSFTCRCGLMFCPKHRHPESHSCDFDYKTEGRKMLEASIPLVLMPKLPKI